MSVETSTGAKTQPGKVLRAGVVGLGWAGEQHMLGYRATPGVELVALAGMEADRLAELGDTYGIQGQYSDLTSMLAGADLDVVSLATPTALHAPMTIEALDHGVHVLTEKPMAESMPAAQSMVDAAVRNNRVLEVTFNKRREATVTALAQLVSDGTLGEIYYAKAGWIRRRGIPGLGSWFTQKDKAGGGPMMDIGIHSLDMALHVLGEPTPTKVSGATYAKFGPRGLGGSSYGVQKTGTDEAVPYEVEDLGTAFVRMDNGSTLLLEASWAQMIEREKFYLSVYGTEGGAELEITGGQPSLVVHTDVAGHPAAVTPILGPPGGHIDCVRDFVAAVQGGDWGSFRGETGLRRTKIIDACYRSAEAGSEVAIND